MLCAYVTLNFVGRGEVFFIAFAAQRSLTHAMSKASLTTCVATLVFIGSACQDPDDPNRYGSGDDTSIETLTGTAPYRGSRIFEIVAEGTRVTEVGELTLPWFARALDPLATRLARAPVREAYGRLRTLLEHEYR